jgi:tRNA (adenine57-N1/adenine58-N1)-methyltransferase
VKRTQAGELAMLVFEEKVKFIFRLDPEGEYQTHQGVILHRDLIDIPWGSEVQSHLGKSFLLFEPTLRDILLHTERKSQIIFPKDIGYILLRLSLGLGKTVIEAGSGSGALTTALAWAVGPTGRVISYDKRQDMIDIAYKNVQQVGLENRVEFRLRDLVEGFQEEEVNALFFDLPQPQNLLHHARRALYAGGTMGAILPTTNQVSELVKALEREHFAMIEVCEILLRFYKTIPERIRPVDRMVAHTGYLVFARLLHTDDH